MHSVSSLCPVSAIFKRSSNVTTVTVGGYGPANLQSHSATPPNTPLLTMADLCKLMKCMANDSDILLHFDDGCVLFGHSQILCQWSTVLRSAIEAEGSGRSFNSTKPLTIPLPGTTQEQWLAAAAFMYPLVPRAAVSCDNLEAVLTIGSKYDCPAFLAEGLTFARGHIDMLDLHDNGDSDYAWWLIQLADSLRLAGASQEWIDLLAASDLTSFTASCTVDSHLDGLLPETLQHVVKTLARASTAKPRFNCLDF